VTEPSRRHAAGLLTVALVVLGAAWIGRVADGRRSIAACDQALKRGDRVEAVVFARAAAEARCPGCAASELGYARLVAIAKELEARGDDANAVTAWRAIRSAALASAVFDTAPPWRERADPEIARLEHRLDAAAAAAGGNASPAATEARLRASLATSLVPSGAVFALLAVGGALLLLGGVRFARSAAFRPLELATALLGGALAIVAVLFF
jgi:hypothetical protein